MRKQPSPARVTPEYEQLRQQLARLGPISQGSVQDRTARKGGGAGYQWTRKVTGKTVTAICQDERSGGKLSPVAPPTQKNGEPFSSDDLQLIPPPTSSQEFDPKSFRH